MLPPLRLRPLFAALLAPVVLATLSAGCAVKKIDRDVPTTENYDPGPPTEYTPPPSSKTQEMDAKKVEMDKLAAEARTGTMTPEEMEQAYKDFERDRQELNRISDAGTPAPPDPPAEAPAGDYPPPPI